MTKRGWEAAEGQVVAVKKNQPQLRDDIAGAFEYGARTRFATLEHDVFETVNKGHGRVERRQYWATSVPSVVGHANDRGEWANMNSVAMIESTRWANRETSVHRRRFMSSRPARADRILRAVRVGRHLVRIRIHWIIGFLGFHRRGVFDRQALIRIRLDCISCYG